MQDNKNEMKNCDLTNPWALGFSFKGEFHVSAHGQTVMSAQLIPLLLKQSKVLMQEKRKRKQCRRSVISH